MVNPDYLHFNQDMTMKNIYCFLVSLLLLGGCEKYDIIDTGLANGDHDCSMWEYFHTDHYDWDSLIVAIERAGVKDVFDGTNPEYKEITLFGITGWSVKRFIRHTPGYTCIADVPVETLRNMILSHVVRGKIMKSEVDFEVKNQLEGGTEVESLTGHRLRIYRTESDFMQMTGEGAEGMGIHGLDSGHIAEVGSADIQVTNGVMHALAYTYEWVEL